MEKDEDVDCILINCFCGHMESDKVAVTVKDALDNAIVTKPIVCRLKGMNAEYANEILNSITNEHLHAVQDLDLACKKAIDYSKKA